MNTGPNEYMATEVMGWHREDKTIGRRNTLLKPMYVDVDCNDCWVCENWHPDEDRGQAIDCAKRLIDDNSWRCEIDIVPHGYSVSIVKHNDIIMGTRFDSKLPLAICKAIKDALEPK